MDTTPGTVGHHCTSKFLVGAGEERRNSQAKQQKNSARANGRCRTPAAARVGRDPAHSVRAAAHQLVEAGSSASTSPATASQHSVRLSLPQVSSRPGSATLHAIASTPLLWAANSRAGEMLFRRSHT